MKSDNVEKQTGNDDHLPPLAAAVLAAVRRAGRQALIEHKQSGDPIVICEGDQVRWIPADEIEIPELPDPA